MNIEKSKNPDDPKIYYVYVYIDPRNFKPFYYGKGMGRRSEAHLNGGNVNMNKKIADIKKDGENPIVRIIASGLNEEQALIVEKTLIWNSPHVLCNLSTGHFQNNFRNPDSLHKEIQGFDYGNSIYFLNVGEGDGKTRCWEDCKEYSFMSGGQDYKKWGRKMEIFKPDDIVLAYLSGSGYVGVGLVEEEAVPASKFLFKNKLLSTYPLKNKNVCSVTGDIKDADFAIKVKWIKAVDRNNAVKAQKDTFINRSMMASMENQKQTLIFLENKFSVKFEILMSKRTK